MLRCINIDWLELYCLEPSVCNADYYRRQGYLVEERDYGTRQYREMFTIYDSDNQPWIEVRRNPVSAEDDGRNKGMFNPFSCHLRLSNYALYKNSPVVDFEDFLFRHNYAVLRIYRLDICLDFERFDCGDNPQDVMRRYMAGKYSKIHQSNISAHGHDLWDSREWNSVSWGAPKSMVSTKFYCKSLELTQAKDKPYIRYAWFLCGLVDDFVNMTKRKADGTIYKPSIWRVEFSIKSSARAWYIIEDNTSRKTKKVAMEHTLNLYESREQLMTAFASLSAHYFRFKIFRQGVRKDRCQDKVLFKFSTEDKVYKIDRLITSQKIDKQFGAYNLKKHLEEYKMCKTDIEVRKAVDVIIADIERYMLSQHLVRMSRKEIRLLQLAIESRIKTGSSVDDAFNYARQVVGLDAY